MIYRRLSTVGLIGKLYFFWFVYLYLYICIYILINDAEKGEQQKVGLISHKHEPLLAVREPSGGRTRPPPTVDVEEEDEDDFPPTIQC